MPKAKMVVLYDFYNESRASFEDIRNNGNMSYLGARGGEGFYVHMWETENEKISAYYIKEGEEVSRVEILHEFETFSVLGECLHNLYKGHTEIEYIEGTPQKVSYDETEQLVRLFYLQIGIDPDSKVPFKDIAYSDKFISGTVDAIRNKALTSLPRSRF